MAIVKPRKKSIAPMGLDREFIRIARMPHVRTSPYYPQSNGKLERWHKSLKSECIRTGIPLTGEDVLRLIQTYVDHYNTVRLHSAIGFVTPTDMLAAARAISCITIRLANIPP